MDFSVLMSVYKNSKPSEVRECMDSLFSQTERASEYIIMIDGEISKELNEYLLELEKTSDGIRLNRLEKNVGLGQALQAGLEKCTYELVARMDTDDICLPERFEKQLECFKNDPDLDVVGTNISEFIDQKDNIVSKRQLPETNDELKVFIKKRTPFNHMSVMYKKSAVLNAGGYIHMQYIEDYFLWIRMHLKGAKFYNIQQCLVLARIDENTFRRRGGWSYYKAEKKRLKFMQKNKIINFFEYFKGKSVRFIIYVLMPNRMRQWFFMKFLRK